MIRYFLVCSFLFLPTLASAATYYVDATGGSNSNAGTDSSIPWQTVSKVNTSTFNPGDQVLFKRGETWREQLSLPSSGLSGNPVTYGAYGTGTKPKISANDIVTGFTTETGTTTDYTATSSLISYWQFEDASSPSLDSTANGNQLSWATGNSRSSNHIQGSYSLTGTGSGPTSRPFASVSSNFPFKATTTAFTIGFWMQASTTFATFDNIFTLTNLSTQGFAFSTNGVNGLRFRIYGTPLVTLDSTNTFNDGAWHQVLARWNGTTVTFWIDGTKQASQASLASTTPVTASNLQLYVGKAGTNFDELFVMNKALSDTDIATIYASGLDGTRNANNLYYKSGYASNPTTVIVDGTLIQNVSAKASLVANTWWYDSVNGRVYLYNNPAGHVIEIGVRSDAISTNGKDFTVVDGFDLQGGVDTLGTYRIGAGSDNTTIQNSEIHNSFTGVQAGGSSGNNQTVQNNVIHTAYADGVVSNEASTTGWKILNNEFYDFANIVGAQTIGSLNPQGIFFNVSDALIDGNYFHDINTVLRTQFQHAIYVTNTTLTTSNNYFYNIGFYGVKLSTNSNNSRVYNNVMYKTGAAVGVFGSTGIQIYNNVMWGANNQSVSGRLASGLFEQSYSGVDSTVTLFKNNIIGENYYFGAPTTQISVDPSNTIANSDYNDIWASSGNTGNQISYQGSNYTFAQWQGLGNDTHSLSADPQFASSTSDFHLLSTSPAINAGISVGLPFRGIAPDIGAYEYLSPPVISAVSTGTPSMSSSTISWTTDVPTTSTINYGLTSSYGSATTSAALVTSHVLTLTGLTASTTYHYQISSTDASSTVATTSDQIFTTTSTVSTTTVPTVTTSPASSISTSSAILNGAITVDGNASSTIRGFQIGTTTSYGFTTTHNGSFGLGSFATSTTGTATLTASTTYHYRAYATNSAGTGYGSDVSFTTSVTPDITPPVISSIASSTATSTATITWTTNELSTTVANYGLTTSYGSASSSAALVTSHTISLTGLTASTTYHFQVQSADAAGNVSTSSDQTFVTTIPSTVVVPTVPPSDDGNGGGGGGGGGRSGSSVSVQTNPVSIPASSPASVISSYLFTRDLTIGATGSDVIALQKILIANGFTIPAGATGLFGPQTKAALMSYQATHAIVPVTGYFGPLTRAFIASSIATPTLTQVPTLSPTLVPTSFGRDLTLGSVGPDVKVLQQLLNTNNYRVASSGAGSPGLETTYFGPATRDALIRLQIALGITPVQGYFGPKTQAVLRERGLI